MGSNFIAVPFDSVTIFFLTCSHTCMVSHFHQKISHSIIELVLALVEDAIEVVVEGVVDEIEKLDITVEELELELEHSHLRQGCYN